MEKLKEKITLKKEQIEEAERQYKCAKKDAKHGSAKEKIVADKKKKALDRLRDQLTKLEVQETDREENKTIALGTSKLNYLDPRITVAWYVFYLCFLRASRFNGILAKSYLYLVSSCPVLVTIVFFLFFYRCKKYKVPIEKIYNKTQRDKFRWAIDMAGPDYIF